LLGIHLLFMINDNTYCALILSTQDDECWKYKLWRDRKHLWTM